MGVAMCAQKHEDCRSQRFVVADFSLLCHAVTLHSILGPMVLLTNLSMHDFGECCAPAVHPTAKVAHKHIARRI